MRFGTTIWVLAVVGWAAASMGCRPAVQLPGVHEPIASEAWQKCAGELGHRESIGMIDDLTLDSKTLLCQGVALAAKGEVEQGLNLLNESSVRDKTDHRPLYMSGRILAEAGRYEEALTAFKRSAGRFPAMAVPTERLGRKILKQRGAEQAQQFLLKAREREMCPYGCQGLIAELHYKAGQSQEASVVYNEMVLAEPDEPSAYIGLARMSNAAGNHQQEVEFIDQAVAAAHFAELSDRQRADIFYSLAFARYNAEQHDGAADAITRATTLRSDRPDWHMLAGWIELKRDRPDDALAAFSRAESLDDKLSAAKIGRGDALIELGRNGKAKKAFKQAQKLDPTDAVILLKLAYVEALTGNKVAARQLVDRATRLDKGRLPPELIAKINDILGR